MYENFKIGGHSVLYYAKQDIVLSLWYYDSLSLKYLSLKY